MQMFGEQEQHLNQPALSNPLLEAAMQVWYWGYLAGI